MASEDDTTVDDDTAVDLGEDDGDDDRPADSDDDVTADDGPAAPERPRRRGLDGRTLAVCALVAFIAAALTYVGLSALGSDDEEQAGEGTLTLAEEVPDLALPRLDGEGELSLADYRGQPLIVNFWGAWCAPCVEEMPDLQAVHAALGDRVAFLGVNVRDSVERARTMAETTGVTYDLVRDVDGELGRALEVTTFPSTFLIDADGTVVDMSRRELSGERLCEKVNQSLLNQSLGADDCV